MNPALIGKLTKIVEDLSVIKREFKTMNRHITDTNKQLKRIANFLEETHKPIIVYDLKKQEFIDKENDN